MKYKTVCYAVISGNEWPVAYCSQSVLILKLPIALGLPLWRRGFNYSDIDRIIVREELE